jgi:hypothetical protein
MYICQLQNTKCGLPPWLSRLRVAISRRKCATIQQKNEWTQKWPYEKDALARESTLCRPSTHWMTLADQKFISLTTIQVGKRIKDKTESFWIRELQTLQDKDREQFCFGGLQDKTVLCPYPTSKTQLFSVLILSPRQNCYLPLSYLQDTTVLCPYPISKTQLFFVLILIRTENSCVLDVG